MKKALSLLPALLAFAALILYPEAMTRSCKYALSLCAELILPSLFPFFVLSILLNKLGLPSAVGRFFAPLASKIYGVTGAGASALIIGLTGGYPMGAAYIADMQKNGAITRSEGERLLAFCNNSGPAFIVGAIGIGVFGSGKLGIILYLIHVFSALLTGLFFRNRSFCKNEQEIFLDSLDLSSALPEAIRQAVSSALNVCGFIIFFSVLIALLNAGGHISMLCGFISRHSGLELHYCKALIAGSLELGSGVGAMQGLKPTAINLSLAAALVSWGGLSVHFQTLSVLSGSEIKGVLHFAGRLITTAISSALAYMVGLLIF